MIPVEHSSWRFHFQEATKHFEYDRARNERAAEQTKDIDTETGEGTGLPLWKVRCLVVDPVLRQGGEANVVVPSATEPMAPFEGQVIFGGLRIKPWAMNNGSSGQSWFADTFALVDTGSSAGGSSAPSSRSKKPAEEAAA